jgi:hypothetical protein
VWSYRLLALKYNGERIAETTENHPERKVIHNRSNDTSKPLLSPTNNLNKDGAVKKKCSGCHGSGYKIPSLQEIYEKKKAKSSKYD